MSLTLINMQLYMAFRLSRAVEYFSSVFSALAEASLNLPCLKELLSLFEGIVSRFTMVVAGFELRS